MAKKTTRPVKKRAKAEFILKKYNRKITDAELISDLKRVAKKLRIKIITRRMYLAHGKYSINVFDNHFGAWKIAVKKAGLKSRVPDNPTVQQLFDNLEKIWKKKKEQPTTSDMKAAGSKYSASPYQGMFGSWQNALKNFVDYINNGKVIDLKGIPEERLRKRKKIPMTQRYKILKRDNFCCSLCGRSPANTGGVTLHIDHIIPVSKGGETIPENLQTLCSECNLSKSNNV